MKVSLPDGSQVELTDTTPSPEKHLAAWLAKRDLPLNTRCGGRGLCRGCEIRMEVDGGIESVKACQHSARPLPREIEIPANSLANRSLIGVSAFDLKIPRQAHRVPQKGLGLALDLGTTTLAGALWDLETGTCLALSTQGNPQRRYGDDVLSRISFSLEEEDGLPLLQRVLIDDGIAPLWADLARQASSGACLDRILVAGNPTMIQTLTGRSLRGLAAYPFHIECGDGYEGSATDLHLPFEGCLSVLPALGPFVGADIVAGAIATGLLEDNRPTLLIDFGTNGEILLRHENCFWATATAAGPAFEGGRLRCGTAARAGSVSSLSLENGIWRLHGADAAASKSLRGLTGAAYVDFLALAVKSGLISSLGRFQRNHSLWKKAGTLDDGEAVLALAPGVVVGEGDIAELLQAKAAIGAGVNVLLEVAGLELAQLERVLVAGGFGYHLHPGRASAIGLIPRVNPGIIEIVGNTSLAGSSLALQYDLRALIQSLKSRCRIIELNQVASFSDHYTEAMELDDTIT